MGGKAGVGEWSSLPELNSIQLFMKPRISPIRLLIGFKRIHTTP